MITFKANLVNTTKVNRINQGEIITKQPVSFVEMSPYSAKDKCSIIKIPNLWGEKRGDSAIIADNFEYIGGEDYSQNSNRFFVLTLQNEDFDRVKPTGILGIMQALKIDKNNIRIDFMQVNPFYMFTNPFGNLKGIGSAMIESLRRTFPNADLTLYPTKNTIEFFKKNGFEFIDNKKTDTSIMQLRKVIK